MPLFKDHWVIMARDGKLTQALRCNQSSLNLDNFHTFQVEIQCKIPILCPVMPSIIYLFICVIIHCVYLVSVEWVSCQLDAFQMDAVNFQRANNTRSSWTRPNETRPR